MELQRSVRRGKHFIDFEPSAKFLCFLQAAHSAFGSLFVVTAAESAVSAADAIPLAYQDYKKRSLSTYNFTYAPGEQVCTFERK